MSVHTSGTPGQVDYEGLDDRPTAAGSAVVADLSRRYGDLTGTVRLLHEDVDEGRRGVRSLELDERTSVKARQDVPSLLSELAIERGLGWSDMAKLVGVSVGAIRKWRKGDGATPDNRRALARLSAFLDAVESADLVEDPAGWLLMRVRDEYTVTAADVYASGLAVELLEYLEEHLSIDDLLDAWDANWRDTTRSAWRVADGPDGERVLVRRD